MPTFRGTSLPLSDLGVESNNKPSKVKDDTDTYLKDPMYLGYIKEPTDRTKQSSQWPGRTAKASVDQSW
jgi:hypothetical protein